MTELDKTIFSIWEPEKPWSNSLDDAASLLEVGHKNGAKAYIIDDYRVDEIYQMALKRAKSIWLQFQGLEKQPIWADIFLASHSWMTSEDLYPYIKNQHCKIMSGMKYVILREQFRDLRTPKIANSIQRVFVSFGGGDDRGGTKFILETLKDQLPSLTFCVATGVNNPSNPDLMDLASSLGKRVELHIGNYEVAALMSSCDIAIISSGTTALEAAATELPMILIPIAENQHRVADSLSNAKAAIKITDLDNLDEAVLLDACSNLLTSHQRTTQKYAARKIGIDGYGAARVASALGELIMPNVSASLL
jgi:spore coat polysaccharide biosynthesis predicted glycosyltransferase SpsG